MTSIRRHPSRSRRAHSAQLCSKMALVKPSPVLAATAAVGLAAYYVLWKRTGNQDNGDDDDDGDDTPTVTRDQVTKFFDLINFEQNSMVAHFTQQIAQFRGKIPEEQLTELATTNFEDHLAKTQQQLLDRMGISEEDMEDASLYYAAEGDTQVNEGMKNLKKMYMAVAGLPSEDAADVPDDLTEEKMVEVIKTYFSVSMNATREVVEDLLSQGKSFQDPSTVMEMNILYGRRSQAAVDVALEPFGLDSSTIQHAIEKFQENDEVMNALKTGTLEQRTLLTQYGLQ